MSDKAAKILHLNASDSGGAFVFAENLIKGLSACSPYVGHHALYSGAAQNINLFNSPRLHKSFAFGQHAAEKFKLLWHEKDSSVRFKFSMSESGMPLKALKALCEPYDLIHLHWINKGFIRLEDLKALNKPLVWTCHDAWPFTGGCHLPNTCRQYEQSCGHCPMLKHPNANDLSAKVFKRKQALYPHLNLHLVSPSLFMQSQIEHSSLGKALPHTCIPNGIDTALFTPDLERSSERFTIGFVAANLNDPNKALRRLIEAMSYLPADFDYQLLLVGQQKQAFDFSLPDHCEIIQNANSKTAMINAYQRMDALVCSSSIETYPTTLMEGFSCGVMGFGFEVGGVPEILNAMQTKAIAAFDTKAMAAALLDYANSKCNKMALHEKARTVFDAQITARAYSKIYDQLLNH